ncbi:hypothetical protein BGZ95_007413, partial [Linnemannia exigua]
RFHNLEIPSSSSSDITFEVKDPQQKSGPQNGIPWLCLAIEATAVATKKYREMTMQIHKLHTVVTSECCVLLVAIMAEFVGINTSFSVTSALIANLTSYSTTRINMLYSDCRMEKGVLAHVVYPGFKKDFKACTEDYCY